MIRGGRTRSAFVGLCALGALATLPLRASAQDSAPPPEATQLFLERLADSNIDAARGQIANIFPLSGNWEFDFLLRDREAILQAVADCRTESIETIGLPGTLMRTANLDCGGERLQLLLMAEDNALSPYVTIVGLVDERMLAANLLRQQTNVPVPPPPRFFATTSAEPMSEKERTRAAEARQLLADRRDSAIAEIALALQSEDLSPVAIHFATDSHFAYRIRDPFFGVDIVLREGAGMAELRAQMAQAREDVGAIAGSDCEGASGSGDVSWPVICQWRLEDSNNRLFSIIRFSGERVSSMQTYYITFDEFIRFRQQAEARGVDVENVEYSFIPDF